MNAEQKSRNAALAERLATDPAFAEKWWAARRSSGAFGKDPNTGTWADFAADNWQTVEGEEWGGTEVYPDVETQPGYARIESIRVVAQALAFRQTTSQADVKELTRVINSGYAGEQHGETSGEGFRTEPLLDEETVGAMVEDPDCEWLLAEAPNGRGAVANGAILACCCFSLGAAAFTTSADADHKEHQPSSQTPPSSSPPPPLPPPPRQKPKRRVGVIRVLAALPEFAGLYVGRRLLQRVERAVLAQAPPPNAPVPPSSTPPMSVSESESGLVKDAGCEENVRLLCCVPDRMTAMLAWAKRRGYHNADGQTAPFPEDMAQSFKFPTLLVVVSKNLFRSSPSTSSVASASSEVVPVPPSAASVQPAATSDTPGAQTHDELPVALPTTDEALRTSGDGKIFTRNQSFSDISRVD